MNREGWVWLRYRRNTSSSSGCWEYMEIPLEDWERGEKSVYANYFEHMDTEYHWSEHHRGYEWEKIDHPPVKWLENNIKNLHDDIERKNKLVKERSLLLDRIRVEGKKKLYKVAYYKIGGSYDEPMFFEVEAYSPGDALDAFRVYAKEADKKGIGYLRAKEEKYWVVEES